MEDIKFTKMVASGNDFVVIERSRRLQVDTAGRSWRSLVKSLCNRKFGIGADGVLILEGARAADVWMRIFNPDGSEAAMCGNGARCTALYISRYWMTASQKSLLKLQTIAGVIEARVSRNSARIKLIEPKDIKLDIPITVNNRQLKVNFINIGVPHVVIFVEGLDKIDVTNLGRPIREHHKFAPRGTNVDFVEVLGNNSIKIRTYERGVEDETLACGTGAVAAALILATRYSQLATRRVNVHTKGGEILKVYFERQRDNFKNIWLEGSRVKIVYKGEYYV